MYDDRDVYISGPLFTPPERAYLESVDAVCVALGLTTYLPHRDAGLALAKGSVARTFFDRDLAMMKQSRGVVAVLNGAEIDSGTAWEVGYACASRKMVLGIREDLRIAEVNLMLSCSMRIVTSLDELRAALGRWKEGRLGANELQT